MVSCPVLLQQPPAKNAKAAAPAKKAAPPPSSSEDEESSEEEDSDEVRAFLAPGDTLSHCCLASQSVALLSWHCCTCPW